eukprot:7730775-Pyramimonas_sp.AAC.1
MVGVSMVEDTVVMELWVVALPVVELPETVDRAVVELSLIVVGVPVVEDRVVEDVALVVVKHSGQLNMQQRLAKQTR